MRWKNKECRIPPGGTENFGAMPLEQCAEKAKEKDSQNFMFSPEASYIEGWSGSWGCRCCPLDECDPGAGVEVDPEKKWNMYKVDLGHKCGDKPASSPEPTPEPTPEPSDSGPCKWHSAKNMHCGTRSGELKWDDELYAA